MMTTFKLVIGRQKWTHKPTGYEVAGCQRPEAYAIKEATPEDFFKWVCEGRCWRAGQLQENAADFKKASFVGSRILALDFDATSYTPADVCNHARDIYGIEPSFYYYSFSQGSKPRNNFRVVWVLDCVLTPEQYEMVYSQLLNSDNLFSQADKATKDISRLWFGTCNGGELLRRDYVPFADFTGFLCLPVLNKLVKAGEKLMKQEDIPAFEPEPAEDDFVIPLVKDARTDEEQYLQWWNILRGKCDLWDKWVDGVYLHYPQRLLLFTELKKLRYPENYKNKSVLSKVMEYYRPELYKDSKCDAREISGFLLNRTSHASNKIVAGKWTIAEFFSSGAYSSFKQERATEISFVEQQQKLDVLIPEVLNRDGIDYVECDVATGKTHRIIEWLKGQDLTKQKIVYAVPRYNTLDEFVERARKAGISEDCICYPAKIDYTLEDLQFLTAGFHKGVKRTPEMAERQKQLDKARNPQEKGLFLLTHTALSYLNPQADVIIIDENIEECLIYKVSITLTALNALRPYLKLGHARAEYDKWLDAIAATPDIGDVPLPDVPAIMSVLDWRGFVGDTAILDDGKKDIGLLERAEKISVNTDYMGRRYIYFELISPLLPDAIKHNTRLKLFTGTSQLTQLKWGYGDEIGDKINLVKVEHAQLMGKVFQYLKWTGSKQKIRDALIGAQQTLESEGVDWREVPLLTLKDAVSLAREIGFYIPQRESNGKLEDLHLGNCSGLDCLKGLDLIVIGKSDWPANVYEDMGHMAITMSRNLCEIAETGQSVMIYSPNASPAREFQQEHQRMIIEQGAGRGRALRYDNTVYVFADFPVRGATEYFY